MPRSRCESRCRRLAEIARSFNLKLVYLFGSQSHLGARYLHGEDPHLSDPLADLDIGVVLMKDDMSPVERSDLYAALSAELQELFGPFTDLCCLKRPIPCLQSEASVANASTAQTRISARPYEERVLLRAADFKPLISFTGKAEERHDKSNPH